MTARRAPRTADELMDEFEQKPEFVERQRARMAEREENRRRYREAAEGLLEDLSAAGFDVDVVAELKKSGDRQAVPVLVRWLQQVEYLPLKRDIIATLGSKWARPDAARALIEEFHRAPAPADPSETGLRWLIGDALERVGDSSVIDELVEIATDAGFGRDRSLVVAALGNTEELERVGPVVSELLDDPLVAGYAAIAAGKLGATDTVAKLRGLAAEHSEQWVRDEARKALGKIVG